METVDGAENRGGPVRYEERYYCKACNTELKSYYDRYPNGGVCRYCGASPPEDEPTVEVYCTKKVVSVPVSRLERIVSLDDYILPLCGRWEFLVIGLLMGVLGGSIFWVSILR